MIDRITKLISSGKVLLSDGAWGTLLQEKGLKPGECPESWNLHYPEKVGEVAMAYVEAGSDLIETNSFGASPFKLAHFGLADETYEINKRAAEISKSASGDDVLVMGSVGPTGVMLIMGDTSPEELFEGFAKQITGLADGGADIICIETMTDLEEAKLAIKAARENTDLDIACTMTFDKTVQGDFKTMMGISPEKMTEELVKAGANIIGTNCGNGMENMIPIVREIRNTNPTIPILVHANAGLPHLENGKNIFDETPEVTASFVPELIRSGANIIGGCCGTTPSHIAHLKKSLT